MGQVAINIRGKQYHISCEDGQEAHVARLGRNLDTRAEELVSSNANISESLMMVMLALLVSDELSDAEGELEDISTGGRGNTLSAAEDNIVESINALCAQIESIAERLEPA